MLKKLLYLIKNRDIRNRLIFLIWCFLWIFLTWKYVRMDLIKWPIIILIIVFSFLSLYKFKDWVIQNVSKINLLTLSITSIPICYFKFDEYFKQLFLLSVFLFSVVITFWVGKGRKSKNFAFIFRDFIRPFFSNIHNSYWKLVWIVIFAIILPFIIHTIFFNELSVDYNLENYTHLTNFYKIWLALMAITIASRIYFEIKNQGKNFEEFTSMILEHFINPSRMKDEIFIVLPTFFIGWHQSRFFHDKFIEVIKKFAKTKDNKFELGILCFENLDLDSIKQSLDLVDVTKLDEAFLKNKEIQDNQTNFQDILDQLVEQSPLFQFHIHWYKGDDKKKEYEQKFNFINDLIRHLIELKDLSSVLENKFTIWHLRKNYFSMNDPINGEVFENNEDFFMLANTSHNNYFFGDFKIKRQEEIQFNSTKFSVTNIQEHIGNFFRDFVKSRQ